MANNSLYIRCTGCGEKIMIAKKFFGSVGYEEWCNGDKIAEFLVKHSESMCYYEDQATVNLFEFINEDELFELGEL